MKVCCILFSFLFSATLFAQTTPLSASAKVYAPDCDLGAAKITASGGKPPYSFQWSNGAIGDTVSSLNAGSYSVKITDSDTNITISFDVVVDICGVSFPTKFSPNGDGINDTWYINRWEKYPNFFVQVFDRWGQVVHQQRSPFIPWDGTHLGIKLPDATYYIVFFYDEKKLSRYEKGNVTILR